LGGSSQAVQLPPGGRQQLSWRYLSGHEGRSALRFSFASGANASWTLDVQSSQNKRADATHASGIVAGERTIGVLVPSGLPDDAVQLEVHASTSLLAELADAADVAQGAEGGEADDVATWA